MSNTMSVFISIIVLWLIFLLSILDTAIKYHSNMKKVVFLAVAATVIYVICILRWFIY